MDPTSFWFLLLMVVVGGFISYYGDILGRNIGKKRKTIHKKIRPKKFAAVVVFIFGCLGTLLTIAVLFATSEPVRSWILEGNAAKAKLASTIKDLKDTEDKFTDAENRLKTLEPELKSKTDEIDKKNKELEDAKIEQLTLNSKNKELDRRGKDLLKKVSSLTSQFKNVNTELVALRKTKTDLDKQVAAAEQNKKVIDADSARIQERNLELEREAVALEKRAEVLQKEFDDLETEYNNLLQASRDADAKFSEQLESYQTDLREAEEELQTTLRTLAREQANLQAVQEGLDRASFSIFNSRFKPQTFAQDAEIARHVLPAGANLAEARRAISVFISETQDVAKEKKAVRSAQGDYADLIESLENGRKISPDEQKARLAQLLIGRPVPTVLVATAKQNTFEGDFIPINIKVFDNVLAFEQGTVIFSMQVDGRKSVSAIVESIIAQIDSGLAETLIRHNMIPVNGSPQPFGQLTTTRIVDIALEIKESGIPLRLQFMATKDLYSADKVQFGHRLRP